MAPKRPSPLDEPPAASSSEEEEEASSEEEEGEEEEASGSESESESEPPKTSTLQSTPEKKPQSKKPDSAAANAKPQSSSSGDSETESESESDGDTLAKRRANAVANVKPIASKPMEETPPPKATKPRSKPSGTPAAAKAGTKRPGGDSESIKDSKKAKKKKGDDQEDEAAEEDSKKAIPFQRLWSDEDEITILKGMIEYTTKNGADPYSDMNAFHEFIKKSLKVDVTKIQLQDKLRRMRKKFENNVKKKKYNPTKPHDVKVFELSKKVWGGGEASTGKVTLASIGKVEQPKSNGKAKSNQKGNKKTLASLKAELLASPESPKEADKSEASLKPCASQSVWSDVIGFDKGFKELGLSETIVKQGLELIGGSKQAELKDKWNKLHVAELELFVKRTELMRDQAKLIVEAFKSSDH